MTQWVPGPGTALSIQWCFWKAAEWTVQSSCWRRALAALWSSRTSLHGFGPMMGVFQKPSAHEWGIMSGISRRPRAQYWPRCWLQFSSNTLQPWLPLNLRITISRTLSIMKLTCLPNSHWVSDCPSTILNPPKLIVELTEGQQSGNTLMGSPSVEWRTGLAETGVAKNLTRLCFQLRHTALSSLCKTLLTPSTVSQSTLVASYSQTLGDSQKLMGGKKNEKVSIFSIKNWEHAKLFTICNFMNFWKCSHIYSSAG